MDRGNVEEVEDYRMLVIRRRRVADRTEVSASPCQDFDMPIRTALV